jgi:hypothetical protein
MESEVTFSNSSTSYKIQLKSIGKLLYAQSCCIKSLDFRSIITSVV